LPLITGKILENDDNQENSKSTRINYSVIMRGYVNDPHSVDFEETAFDISLA
jgi:hypothetical protein